MKELKKESDEKRETRMILVSGLPKGPRKTAFHVYVDHVVN